MSKANRCYTYFKIDGSFDPDVISKLLELTPEKTWKIGDLRSNGTKYTFSHWAFGRCDEYDGMVENQMRKTIAPLSDKLPILNRIREQYDASLFLVVVPIAYVENSTPCLAPPLDVMDFCHATRTQIDIDLYILGEEE